MLKKLLVFFVMGLIAHGIALADPEDCMSKSEAETLLTKLKKERYIIDYCDCCADGDPSVTANLLFIKKMSIVSCEYDTERFSVRMETQLVSSFSIKNQRYAGNATYAGNSMEFALLNYQFFFTNKKASHLGFLVRADYEAPNCSGLQGFPSPAMVNDKKYAAWFKKK